MLIGGLGSLMSPDTYFDMNSLRRSLVVSRFDNNLYTDVILTPMCLSEYHSREIKSDPFMLQIHLRHKDVVSFMFFWPFFIDTHFTKGCSEERSSRLSETRWIAEQLRNDSNKIK